MVTVGCGLWAGACRLWGMGCGARGVSRGLGSLCGVRIGSSSTALPSPVPQRACAACTRACADAPQPLGVVAGICPFNFPAMIPLWMFPVATVCGNTFVLKPSEKDPGAAMVRAALPALGPTPACAG